MRSVRRAIWTSGEPVSCSWVANLTIVSFLRAVARLIRRSLLLRAFFGCASLLEPTRVSTEMRGFAPLFPVLEYAAQRETARARRLGDRDQPPRRVEQAERPRRARRRGDRSQHRLLPHAQPPLRLRVDGHR